MPALIAKGNGQALRVTMYLPESAFQFFSENAYRTLLIVPIRGELRDAAGAGSLRRN